jgi:hypothetical protein
MEMEKEMEPCLPATGHAALLKPITFGVLFPLE